ncbi:MAG: hypothetical protein P3C12_09015 [Gemmatimonadota bacterium]|nr:hypothetical protein [Gemmatimonadota bacterium]
MRIYGHPVISLTHLARRMLRSLLAPGCEKAPASPNLQYVPADSTPYKVTARDSWWTLADRPEAKAAKLSALDLCVYNFRTRVPAEINWYLRNKVGCTTATGDKQNYKFSDDAAPGIVYLPKPAAAGKRPPLEMETPFGGKVPSSNPATGVEEFTIDKESKIFSMLRVVRARVKITGKLTVNWGSLSPDIKAKASANLFKKEFGASAEAKIGQDLSLNYGMKIKAEDVGNPKAWKKAIAEASEVSVKKKFNNVFFKDGSTGFRVPKDGLFYFVKFSTNEAKLAQADLSWILDLPPGDAGITVRFSGEITITVGPGEAQLQYVANLVRGAITPGVGAITPGVGAIGGLAGWVAFAGYGIAHTMNKADRLAFQSWYVTGYVDAVFPPVGAPNHQLPPKPEDRRRAEEMLRVGRQDAEMTARTDYANDGMPPMQAYRLYLLGVLDADNDPYAARQARGLLRDHVNSRVNAKLGAS